MVLMLCRSLFSSSSRSIIAANHHQAAALFSSSSFSRYVHNNNILGLGRSSSNPLLFRPFSSLRPGIAAACFTKLHAAWLAAISPSLAMRGFATSSSSSSSSDPNPNKKLASETSDDGGVKRWRVVMEELPCWYNPTRDDIIKSYTKTLAKVVGSEEEAKKKLAVLYKYPDLRLNIIPNEFIARLPENVAVKIKELPGVTRVVLDTSPPPPSSLTEVFGKILLLLGRELGVTTVVHLLLLLVLGLGFVIWYFVNFPHFAFKFILLCWLFGPDKWVLFLLLILTGTIPL